MLKLTGLLVNTFKTQAGVNAKGEEYEAKDKIQLLCDVELQNGDLKKELITLSVENSSLYDSFLNQFLTLNIGVLAMNRTVVFYVLKGFKPA